MYPEIRVRVLQVHPLAVSDDARHFQLLTDFEDKLIRCGFTLKPGQIIELTHWNLEIAAHDQSDMISLKFEVQNFRVEEFLAENDFLDLSKL